MHIVQLGCLKPMCDLLTVDNTTLVLRMLEALENILRVSEQVRTDGLNDVVTLVKERAV